jgi:glycosyltransferase involved in cell wall biosynthesis
MTRLLFVADSLMAGGIESQLVELVLGLDRKRFEPHVLSLYGPSARDLHFAPHLRAAGVPLVLPDLGWTAHDKVKGVAAITRAARRLRPHIIQAEGYHANLLTRLAWPLLPRRSRLIGSLRGVHTSKQMRYERLSHWTCAHMVTNAPHLKADAVARGHVPANHITCIPNGIALDHYAQPHDPHLRERLAPGARLVLVSLGRISLEKNLHWTVQALGTLKRQGRLPDGLRLLIVGAGQEQRAQDMLDAAIREDNLCGIVTQHPASDHPEDLYYACDAVILFSPNEGLPNVAIESLAAGRPVVISTAANQAGIIEDARTGWVVPTGNVDRLADTLYTLTGLSGSCWAGIRNTCREHATFYSVVHLVDRYSALYERVVATPA